MIGAFRLKDISEEWIIPHRFDIIPHMTSELGEIICFEACRNTCKTGNPVKIDGKPAMVYILCANYTCADTGMPAARDAIGKNPKIIRTPNGDILATRFGTTKKPTYKGDFGRFVTNEGHIYAGKVKENFFTPTGQKAV